MIINNCQPEDIIVIIDDIVYNIPAHASKKIDISSDVINCQINHSSGLSNWKNTFSDNILKNFTEITAIIVDSSYKISKVTNDLELDVTNELILYEKDDICIICFGITCKNAEIELVSFNSNNVGKLLGVRKLLLLFDANDFPIISPIMAIVRYIRLKKIISRHNVHLVLSSKIGG